MLTFNAILTEESNPKQARVEQELKYRRHSQMKLMDASPEGKLKADAGARKVRPEVEGFIERVVAPALVNRYIRELKEGKNPLTKGSAAETTLRGNEARVREILAAVKPLAAEYYRLTGKPLGVTRELAEYVAAEILG